MPTKSTPRPAFNADRMTTAQAADYLGLKVSTLESWRSEARDDAPPYMKLGGRVFYRQSTLDEWIEKNTVETT